eukprot:763169-Hanusia_phi.AAC.1
MALIGPGADNDEVKRNPFGRGSELDPTNQAAAPGFEGTSGRLFELAKSCARWQQIFFSSKLAGGTSLWPRGGPSLSLLRTAPGRCRRRPAGHSRLPTSSLVPPSPDPEARRMLWPGPQRSRREVEPRPAAGPGGSAARGCQRICQLFNVPS